jgi:hypothetical protein
VTVTLSASLKLPKTWLPETVKVPAAVPIVPNCAEPSSQVMIAVKSAATARPTSP